MHVGIVYDLKEDYGIDAKDLSFCDFSNLIEIQHIKHTLETQGHLVTLIGSPKEFAHQLRQHSINYIEIVLNFGEGFGSRNRECLVPALCEIYNIPYTFSDCHAMSLTLHKHQTLLFAESLGISTPKGFLFNPLLNSFDYINDLCLKHSVDFPIVTKPNREGSSMGILIAQNYQELISNIDTTYARYEQEIRCDEYIGGHEIAVPIIGNGMFARAMGIVEYQNHDGTPITFYTTKIKDKGGHKTVYQSFGKKIDKKITDIALLIHRSIPCYDLSRIDMKLYKETPYLLEVTPLPGLNPGSTFEMCATKIGLSVGEFYDEILTSALARYEK